MELLGLEPPTLNIGDIPQDNGMEIEPSPQKPLQPIPLEEGTVSGSSDLWTKKYKPLRLSEIIGNTTVINAIITWLRDWNDVVLRGNKKPVNWRGHYST